MYRLLTDTTANLPAPLTARHGIEVLPLHYTVAGKEYARPGGAGEAELRGFYAAMRAGAEVHTSMISIGAFFDAFEPILAAGEDILYVGMSSGISGTCRAAAFAAEELRNRYPDRRVAVVDTRAASLGEGLPVLYAAGLREAGLPLEEAARRTSAKSARVCQYFTVDDLAYLRRGGRISGAAALVGSVLNIKPVLRGDEEGRIVVDHKVRGRKKSLDALVEQYARLRADPAGPAAIAHADAPEDTAYLTRCLRAAGLTGELITAVYEPVTGSHVGPGAVALFFYGTRR